MPEGSPVVVSAVPITGFLILTELVGRGVVHLHIITFTRSIAVDEDVSTL